MNALPLIRELAYFCTSFCFWLFIQCINYLVHTLYFNGYISACCWWIVFTKHSADQFSWVICNKDLFWKTQKWIIDRYEVLCINTLRYKQTRRTKITILQDPSLTSKSVNSCGILRSDNVLFFSNLGLSVEQFSFLSGNYDQVMKGIRSYPICPSVRHRGEEHESNAWRYCDHQREVNRNKGCDVRWLQGIHVGVARKVPASLRFFPDVIRSRLATQSSSAMVPIPRLIKRR